jgi:hypothetical protein
MRRRGRAAGTLCLLALSVGCGGGGPTGPPGPELSHLSLFPDRIVALVDDRVELRVTARDLDGVEVQGYVPQYTSTNPAVVTIHPEGLIIAASAGTATVRAIGRGQTAETTMYVGNASYDLDALGPPRVLPSNYIDISKIERISRFRSTIGHDYSFARETCRSMKHYYQPKSSVDWTTVDIYAPASGTIQGLRIDGFAGHQIRMAPRDLPWLSILLFHVDLDPGIVTNMWVEAGDHLGTHASQNTMSDIAMSLGPQETGILLSSFDAMTDDVFAEYEARGVPSREAAIITEAERDADPGTCSALGQFTAQGGIENWLVLN